MKPRFFSFICCFIIGCTSVGEINATSLAAQERVNWAYLIGDNEGVVKACYNRRLNQICREKTDEVTVDCRSIHSNKKVYISIISPKHCLTYKSEADFYWEDKQGQLHEVPKENLDEESVALEFEKGETAEIGVDFPKNCQPGDYLLKIRVYNEKDEYYEIYQWFEAYTSKRNSSRRKPIPSGVPNSSGIANYIDQENGDDVFQVVRNMPVFPGGMPKLMEFIQNNLQYPEAGNENGIKRYVIVQVIIEKDGTATHPVVIRGISPALDKEALRVAGLMPKWKPGSQHGVTLRVKVTFPVTFIHSTIIRTKKSGGISFRR